MKRVLSEGVEIAFEDTGHGEPALVLIHGAFGNRSQFSPLVDHLAERHRVITFDLRGHGEP
jgi:pimeloyl-ACP methyl ester carboxylesterase